MKHLSTLLVTIATLALGSSHSASAQTLAAPVLAAADGPAKVGVIAFQTAVSQTNEFQRNLADLQKKYEPKANELKGLSAEIESLEKQLQVQGDKLSEAEQASRTRVIEEKQKQAKRLSDDTQSDFQQEMQDVFNGVAAKMGDLVTAYAQQLGITLVLDVSQQQQAPLVLFAPPSVDITQAVLEAYNQQSGVAAPVAAAPKPTAKAPARP